MESSRLKYQIFLALSFVLLSPLSAQEWNDGQRSIVRQIEALSATTVPSGEGPVGYAELLSPDFTRWTLGSDHISRKQDWIRGIEDWWDDGWRVIERDGETNEITILGELAFVRRTAYERFQSPAGEAGEMAGAALAEVWRIEAGEWRLWRVDITLID